MCSLSFQKEPSMFLVFKCQIILWTWYDYEYHVISCALLIKSDWVSQTYIIIMAT